MKIRKRGKRRKQHRSGNSLFNIMLYLFVKPINLLFSFSIYLLKSMWLLFSFSIRLLYKLVKQLPKNYISKPAIRTLAEIDEMDGYKFEEIY